MWWEVEILQVKSGGGAEDASAELRKWWDVGRRDWGNGSEEAGEGFRGGFSGGVGEGVSVRF